MVVRIPGPEFYPPKPPPDPEEAERTRRAQEKLDRYQRLELVLYLLLGVLVANGDGPLTEMLGRWLSLR